MQNEINYYFVYGDNMDEVVSGYRTLTGKSPIMPKWAMGYWQSREKYNTKEEVLSTLKEFRKRRIPIDNIVIDWEAMNSTLNVFPTPRGWCTLSIP